MRKPTWQSGLFPNKPYSIGGIAKEGQEIMDEYKGMLAHDAGLLAAAQAVEHYEMTRYGTLRT